MCVSNAFLGALPVCAELAPFFLSVTPKSGFCASNKKKASVLGLAKLTTSAPPSSDVYHHHRHEDDVKDVKPFLALVKKEPRETTVGQTVKPVRLTINGKRIGRPPGTYKRPQIVVKKEVVSNDPKVHDCKWGICDRSFVDENLFYEHVEKHVDAMIRGPELPPYICRWAECVHHGSSARYLLMTHMRRHTGMKPNVCEWPDCNKRYSRLENLKTHRRLHTGEKPYHCRFPSCEKTFTNASDCSKHQNRVHNSDKPFTCIYPECTKRYTDPSSLRKHVKGVHADFEEATAHIPKPERRRIYQKYSAQQAQASQQSPLALAQALAAAHQKAMQFQHMQQMLQAQQAHQMYMANVQQAVALNWALRNSVGLNQFQPTMPTHPLLAASMMPFSQIPQLPNFSHLPMGALSQQEGAISKDADDDVQFLNFVTRL
ncbi:unnamed protein product [Caenorhabditis sp. 36 PRJEB53466]|nr:unnamed protein product [Caenorhabditis sp. 36 PRJEB53466]